VLVVREPERGIRDCLIHPFHADQLLAGACSADYRDIRRSDPESLGEKPTQRLIGATVLRRGDNSGNDPAVVGRNQFFAARPRPDPDSKLGGRHLDIITDADVLRASGDRVQRVCGSGLGIRNRLLDRAGGENHRGREADDADDGKGNHREYVGPVS